MPNIALSEVRVKALRPRRVAYDIRDRKLRAFGVRVMPSGARRFFIHTRHRGQRIWKTVGNASAMNVNEARKRAASLLAAIRCDTDAPASPDATRFESVAETVFQRYARVWKPQTLYVNRNSLHRQILPWFASMQVADITRADVRRWFASRRATPVGADRSMPILSVILKEAERMGYRPEGSNPCREIRRYRRKGRERFLCDAEIGRLAACLSAHEGERPPQVAAVRLLLLTGCRVPPAVPEMDGSPLVIDAGDLPFVALLDTEGLVRTVEDHRVTRSVVRAVRHLGPGHPPRDQALPAPGRTVNRLSNGRPRRHVRSSSFRGRGS